jgi:hypothetical protein
MVAKWLLRLPLDHGNARKSLMRLVGPCRDRTYDQEIKSL